MARRSALEALMLTRHRPPFPTHTVLLRPAAAAAVALATLGPIRARWR